MLDIYHKLLKKIAHIQVKHPIMVVLLLLAATAAMAGGINQVRTVASLEQMMPVTQPSVQAFNSLRDAGIGRDLVAIVVKVDPDSGVSGVMDITDERVYDYLNELSAELESEPDVIEIWSYAQMIDPSMDYDESLNSPIVQARIDEFVSKDKATTMLLFSTDVAADDTRMLLLVERVQDILEAHGKPVGTKIELTGTPVIQQRLGEMISQDRTNTSWISTLLVFIITALIFASFSSAVVPILIVTGSVFWLYGTMGYTDLPISTLAGGVAAMVIGIGIDFAIHIMNKFKHERKKGLSIANAVEMAVVETGTALTATSLTTTAAFLAFLVGSMPEMGRFGILMSIGIAYALFFSIVGLPALLILEEKLLIWIKSKGRFGIEGEYHLEGGAKK